jgi:hypothetical protein
VDDEREQDGAVIHAILTLIHAILALIHAILTLIHAILTLIHAIRTLARAMEKNMGNIPVDKWDTSENPLYA